MIPRNGSSIVMMIKEKTVWGVVLLKIRGLISGNSEMLSRFNDFYRVIKEYFVAFSLFFESKSEIIGFNTVIFNRISLQRNKARTLRGIIRGKLLNLFTIIHHFSVFKVVSIFDRTVNYSM